MVEFGKTLPIGIYLKSKAAMFGKYLKNLIFLIMMACQGHEYTQREHSKGDSQFGSVQNSRNDTGLSGDPEKSLDSKGYRGSGDLEKSDFESGAEFVEPYRSDEVDENKNSVTPSDSEAGGSAQKEDTKIDEDNLNNESAENSGESDKALECETIANQGCDYVDSLLENRIGYGRDTVGGLGGKVYKVVNLNEEGDGSLRKALTQKDPLWVVVEVKGTLVLSEKIKIESNKTIDGRNGELKIVGQGLEFNDKENLMMVNIALQDGVSGDGLGISESKKVYILNNYFEDFGDGLLDIKRGSESITIGYNKFINHDKVMLISHSNTDFESKKTRVTLHHNLFIDTVQRHPRVRFATVHIFNNLFQNWRSYAIGGAFDSRLYIEGNIFNPLTDFDAILDDVGVDSEENYSSIYEQNNQFNGSRLSMKGEVKKPFVFEDYKYTVSAADDDLKQLILSKAGVTFNVETSNPKYGNNRTD